MGVSHQGTEKFTSIYAHLSKTFVTLHEPVQRGQLIGLSGTGTTPPGIICISRLLNRAETGSGIPILGIRNGSGWVESRNASPGTGIIPAGRRTRSPSRWPVRNIRRIFRKRERSRISIRPVRRARNHIPEGATLKPVRSLPAENQGCCFGGPG